jgi:hypothetical protein
LHPFVPRLKPVPVTTTAGADKSTLPLLVSVTVLLLGVPAGTLPKFIFLDDKPTASLLLLEVGLDCATARPPITSKTIAVIVQTARITRRRYTNVRLSTN